MSPSLHGITPHRATLFPVNTKLPFVWHFGQSTSKDTFVPLQEISSKVEYVPGNGIGIGTSFRWYSWDAVYTQRYEAVPEHVPFPLLSYCAA